MAFRKMSQTLQADWYRLGEDTDLRRTKLDGVTVDADGRVTRLALNGKGIAGR